MVEDGALADVPISKSRRALFPIRVIREVGETVMTPYLRPIDGINAGIIAYAITHLPQTDDPISDELLAQLLGFGIDPMAIAKVSIEIAVLFDYGLTPLENDGPTPRYKLVDRELVAKIADDFIQNGIIPKSRKNLQTSPDY